MIDLLREQLYHQQMCISRDVNFAEEDNEDGTSECPSAMSGLTCSSADVTWMSDISSQMMELRSSLEKSHVTQKQEMQERISEVS